MPSWQPLQKNPRPNVCGWMICQKATSQQCLSGAGGTVVAAAATHQPGIKTGNGQSHLLVTLVLSGYSHKISFDNICLDDAILFMVVYL